ncbi:MAG: hypothetical protein H6825_08850 [Planctomycetes bacterium]|nr:hypothetical protein [Planctomycetota bacterium]
MIGSVLLVAVACSSPGAATPAPDAADAPVADGAASDAPATAEAESVTKGWREKTVEGLIVRWRPLPDPIPLNKLFNLDIELANPTGGPVDGVTQMRVDAKMPAHGHGMTRQAQTIMDGSERAHAVGLLFHMVGEWEVSVDVYRDQHWISAKWTETLE